MDNEVCEQNNEKYSVRYYGADKKALEVRCGMLDISDDYFVKCSIILPNEDTKNSPVPNVDCVALIPKHRIISVRNRIYNSY